MQYVGITSSDPFLREAEWIRQGKIIANFTVVQSWLTYEQAFRLELRYRAMGYIAEASGPIVYGPVYSVYTFEY